MRRARALDPRLELDEGDLATIERICARLDGLPLAIELAAARMKVLSPAAILARLEHRLDLLSAGPRDAPARQQTLRAAIGWSYDLLEPADRELFAALGVFVGGFARGRRGGVRACRARRDRRRSSTTAWSRRAGRGSRCSRPCASTRSSGSSRPARPKPCAAGHAQAFADALDDGERGLAGPEAALWLQNLDADRENVRAAISYSLGHGDAETALRICAGVWRYWIARGNLTEGRAFTTRALAGAGASPRCGSARSTGRA